MSKNIDALESQRVSTNIYSLDPIILFIAIHQRMLHNKSKSLLCLFPLCSLYVLIVFSWRSLGVLFVLFVAGEVGCLSLIYTTALVLVSALFQYIHRWEGLGR